MRPSASAATVSRLPTPCWLTSPASSPPNGPNAPGSARAGIRRLPRSSPRLYIRGVVCAAEARCPMQPVSILLNLLWILLGGAWMAAGWLIAAVIMAITIIGLPWARAAFHIAVYTLLPFGSRAVNRTELTGMDAVGTGPLGV